MQEFITYFCIFEFLKSNEERQDVTKIIKFLEDLLISIKTDNKRSESETKQSGFLCILLRTLGLFFGK